MKLILRALVAIPLCLIVSQLWAAVETFEFSSDELRERYSTLVAELRCPKCQNQNLAGSDSPISSDLRREVYLLLEEGKSDQQVIDFLVERYGVFILYDPPVAGVTLWVWLTPILFVLVGASLFIFAVRGASKRPIDDDEEDDLL